jgi:hypothetical protein
MSVRNVHWSPDGGVTARSVPACSACAHKAGQGVQPGIRKVETHGALISYVDAGFARCTGPVTASTSLASLVKCLRGTRTIEFPPGRRATARRDCPETGRFAGTGPDGSGL